MHAVRAVATPDEAAAVLEYFNGFHDGFIEQLTLASHDYRGGSILFAWPVSLLLAVLHRKYSGV